MAKINLSNFPNAPGVYMFKDKNDRIIYIGKSANLKARINSYLKSSEVYSPLKKALLKNLAKVYCKTTDSEIEALILESRLIKKHQPKYNVLLKDQSRYFYLVVTKEDFPRLIVTHQPEKIKLARTVLGPFTEGTSLKNTLRILRKIFPFRTCKNPVNKPCLDYELGLCPAHSDFASPKNYAKNLKNLFLILRNKKTDLIKNLKKEMFGLSKRRLYEEAEKVRKKIFYLQNVFNHEKVLKEEIVRVWDEWQEAEKELKLILKSGRKIRRMEGYDVSNIQGEFATGAMSVVVNGKPAKSEYRKFKIKAAQAKDDISRLKEIIERRLKHKEWGYPDLILIDGGKAHLNLLKKILIESQFQKRVRAIALAKAEETIYTDKGGILSLKKYRKIYPFLAFLRDEAHCFARRYHQKLRKS